MERISPCDENKREISFGFGGKSFHRPNFFGNIDFAIMEIRKVRKLLN